jgi:hypothetical protein
MSKTTRPTEVYGWLGWRLESSSSPNGGHQTRELLAASSVAEVLRRTGISRSVYELQGDTTGNAEEIALAMSRPGVNFWRPLDDTRPDAWHADESSLEERS